MVQDTETNLFKISETTSWTFL